MSPPLRKDLHSASTRDAGSGRGVSADGPKSGYSDIETSDLAPERAPELSRTPSPRRPKPGRTTTNPRARLSVKRDTSANPNCDATSPLAAPANPATTTPSALPRGRRQSADGPRSANRSGRATRGLSGVATRGARAQGRAATEKATNRRDVCEDGVQTRSIQPHQPKPA
jgi:hypothetical protein